MNADYADLIRGHPRYLRPFFLAIFLCVFHVLFDQLFH